MGLSWPPTNIRFSLTRDGSDHLVDEAREVKSKLHHSRHVLVAFTLKVTPVSKTGNSKVIVIGKQDYFSAKKKHKAFHLISKLKLDW